jgi:hypothetical protein
MCCQRVGGRGGGIQGGLEGIKGVLGEGSRGGLGGCPLGLMLSAARDLGEALLGLVRVFLSWLRWVI